MSATFLLTSRAAVALHQSPLAAIRRLSVQETETSVMILGRVNSYYLKQVAQETVMPALDGRALVNRVTVVVR